MNDSEKIFFILFIPSFAIFVWGLLAVGINGGYYPVNTALPLGMILIVISLLIKWRVDKKT